MVLLYFYPKAGITRCRFFEQLIGKWDVSSVEDMNNMFYMARSFNQPIGEWNVSAVEDMRGMFLDAAKFNQPINTEGDSWDVSAVENMTYMFYGAHAFNQNISGWNVANVNSYTDFRSRSGLSISNTPPKFR